MAFQSVWYFTDLPEEIVNIIEKDLLIVLMKVCLTPKSGDNLNKEKRNSKNSWVPTNHWVAGFIWHYMMKANRENFLYDLECIDGESIQYTEYREGQFYTWHNDAGISNMHDDEYGEKTIFCPSIV